MRPLAWILMPAVVAALGACQRTAPPVPPASPASLVDEARRLGLTRVYANPAARADLPSGLLAGTEDTSQAPSCREPEQWRRLFRAQRFDGVLLAGPSVEFQPLLEHLATSPDFRLAQLSPAGALFVPGTPAPFTPPPAERAARAFDKDRGLQLSRLALLLNLTGHRSAARDYAAAALAADPNDPVVHVGVAALALAQKDYPRAVAEANAALKLRPGDPAALDVMARTLAAAGNPDAAWRVASELKSRVGDADMNVLFLHARLANAARAYADEQDSLERLVKLAGDRGLPSVDFRIYLGQSYARQGLARPALEQFEAASRSPDLTPAQKRDVATAIATIRQRAGNLGD